MKETIVYNSKRYNRYPDSKRSHLRNYYWRHDKWKEPPVALHRQIWADNYGAIPEKHQIHHKDENTLNNSIENLECLSVSAHIEKHLNPLLGDKKATCLYKYCGKEFTYRQPFIKAKFCSVKCWRRNKNNLTPDKFKS